MRKTAARLKRNILCTFNCVIQRGKIYIQRSVKVKFDRPCRGPTWSCIQLIVPWFTINSRSTVTMWFDAWISNAIAVARLRGKIWIDCLLAICRCASHQESDSNAPIGQPKFAIKLRTIVFHRYLLPYYLLHKFLLITLVLVWPGIQYPSWKWQILRWKIRWILRARP